MKKSALHASAGILALIVILLTGETATVLAQGWPNEPAGSSLITENALTQVAAPGWTLYANTNPGPGSYGVDVFNDATAPSTDKQVFRYRFPIGFPAGISPGNYYFPLPAGLNEIYLGFWWKVSPGFESQVAGTKLGFLMDYDMSTIPFIFSHNGLFGPYPMGTYMPSSPKVNNCQVNVQSYGDCPGTRNFFQTGFPEGTITPGVWYRWEIYQKRSTTLTSQDGILRIWVTKQGESPVLKMNATNVNGPGAGWYQYEMNPTWGGTDTHYGDNGATQDGFFYYDHVRISAPHGDNGFVAPVMISTLSLPAARAGTPYSATLSATGGKAPYGWTISSGSLHQGLTLNKSTGVISGTPASCGRSDFTVKVMDSNVPAREATKNLTIIVSGTCASGIEESKKLTVNGSRITARTKIGSVEIQVPGNGAYSLQVYDLSGREVWRHSGRGEAIWNHAGKLKKGVYLVRAERDGRSSFMNYSHIQ